MLKCMDSIQSSSSSSSSSSSLCPLEAPPLSISSAVIVEITCDLGYVHVDSTLKPAFSNPGYRRLSRSFGAIVSPDGLILARCDFLYHESMESPSQGCLQILFDNKAYYKVTVVHIDVRLRVAILKISSSEPLPFLKLCSSVDNLITGEQLQVLGISHGPGRSFANLPCTVGEHSSCKDGICNNYFHTDWGIKVDPSVYINRHGEIVGLVMKTCGCDGDLRHGLSVDSFSELVKQCKSLSEDIRPSFSLNVPHPRNHPHPCGYLSTSSPANPDPTGYLQSSQAFFQRRCEEQERQLNEISGRLRKLEQTP